MLKKCRCKCCGKEYSIIPNITGLCEDCNSLSKTKSNYRNSELLIRNDLSTFNKEDFEVFEGLNNGVIPIMNTINEIEQKRKKHIETLLEEHLKAMGINLKEELEKEPYRIFKKFIVIRDKRSKTTQYRMRDNTDDGYLIMEIPEFKIEYKYDDN